MSATREYNSLRQKQLTNQIGGSRRRLLAIVSIHTLRRHCEGSGFLLLQLISWLRVRWSRVSDPRLFGNESTTSAVTAMLLYDNNDGTIDL